MPRLMRPTLRLIAGLLLLLTTANSPALGQTFKTGNDLFAVCNLQNQAAKGACVGYIAGVAEVIQAYDGELWGRRTCDLEKGTIGQYRDIVMSHLTAYPQVRHHRTVLLILHALSTAFPCE
jgi:hypothetical protein